MVGAQVGTPYKRFFKLDADRLTLTTAPFTCGGQELVNNLTWERMTEYTIK